MENNLTIAVDLDGTIAEYDGWKGEKHFGRPKPYAHEALQKMRQMGMKVIIHTARKHKGLVKQYLESENLPYDKIARNIDGKPIADVYLDDKGMKFKNWIQAMTDVMFEMDKGYSDDVFDLIVSKKPKKNPKKRKAVVEDEDAGKTQFVRLGHSSLSIAGIGDVVKAAYRLQGRMELQGLPISIENRRGSVRRGTDKDGHEWKTKVRDPYGYVRLTEGGDGEHLDCFIGPNKESDKVFILHLKQADDPTKWDEDKVYLGFDSRKDAIGSFQTHYDKAGQKLYGGMTEMNMAAFKQKIENLKGKILKSQKVKTRNILFKRAIQHRLNPLSFYCRLRDCGISKNMAKSMTRRYERVYVETSLGNETIKAHVRQHWRTRGGRTEFVHSHETHRTVLDKHPGTKPPELLRYKTVSDLKKVYEREYLGTKIEDPQGRAIGFNDFNFQHLTKIDSGRPDHYRCKRLMWIKDIIKDPDEIRQDPKDPQARLYIKKYLHCDYKGCKAARYLFVVKVDKEGVHPITAYPITHKYKMRQILSGMLLFEAMRKSLVSVVNL
jgi:hypothetical protein